MGTGLGFVNVCFPVSGGLMISVVCVRCYLSADDDWLICYSAQLGKRIQDQEGGGHCY